MIKSEKGFTIVETMMFLAISGVTFAMAVMILGNQQRTTQFNQSARELESSLNDIANDTSTGVFPYIQDVACVRAGTDSLSFVSNPGRSPGENNECVFVGKVIQFRDGDINTNSEYVLVHTLVGVNDLGNRSFLATRPVPLYSDGSGVTADFDGTETISIPWGTTVTRAYYEESDGAVFIRGIAFVYNNFGAGLGGGEFKSGAASIGLYAVVDATSQDEANASLSRDDFRSSINTQSGNNSSDYRSITDKITICLQGAGGRLGMIEIGGQSGSVSARTNFDITAECRG